MIEDNTRQLLAAGLLLSYSGLCAWLWRRQRATKKPVHIKENAALVVWASQGGNAQQLAQQLHQQFLTAGQSAHCLALDQLTTDQLHSSTHIVFIVSTFGDGEAPDHARLFLKKLSANCDLQHLKIHVLGLGDRQYPLFCEFAKQLQARLTAQGAQVSLPLMTVDNMHAQDLAHWHSHTANLFAIEAAQPSPYQPTWLTATLLERKHLNPYSSSPGLYKLRFKTEHNNWQAGDTLLIHPANNPAFSTREYSIASSATSGFLDLIVRLSYSDKKTIGQCSGWLCHSLTVNEDIKFSPCTKPNFHAMHNSKPAIFIGAGSGLAGLRAHISERPKLSQNWLVFGERCPDTDMLLAEELSQWHRSNHLTYLDCAFSRDPLEPRYVQDYLQKHQHRLMTWLAEGATIYVCGRLQGMGRGVQHMLIDLLGEEQLHSLQQQGRYRTDLY